MFTVENATQIPADIEDDHEVPAMQPITINSADVASGLKPFKATDPDDISAYLLKETANQLAPSLTQVFKVSLYQLKLPKTAHIIPACTQKSDRSLPINYRPISLTSLCCKALEHISYLIKYLFTPVSSQILCDAQQPAVVGAYQ